VKVVVLLSWVSRGGGPNLAFEVIDGIRRRGIAVVPVVAQLKPVRTVARSVMAMSGFRRRLSQSVCSDDRRATALRHSQRRAT
jgi:hypothetical protein